MNILAFILAISILTFLMVSCFFYVFIYNVKQSHTLPDLVKPAPHLLKAWTKKEKKKPKVNDDDNAWKKENNLE